MRSCETCLYGKRLYVIARADEVMRCFRPRQMLMSGFEEAGRNGFDAVHAWFKAGNTGTADECAVAIHEEPLTVRPRVSQLHSAGFIEPTGERRKSLAGGRSSHVWRRVS